MRRKISLYLIILILLFPLNIFAYSNKIFVGGETIGIEVNADGIYVVGFYPVNHKEIAKDAGFLVGDIIKKIDNQDVLDINSLNKIIDTEKDYEFEVLRGNIKKNITMHLELEDNILKTGLYVKDKINGIGTLSYIDPETKIFGSLGHEILESTSFSKFIISDGTIYKAEVDSIKKSIDGITGEKNANIDRNTKIGIIDLNETEGIFGRYKDDILDKDLYEVGKISDIKKGDAYIKTVIKNNKIEEFNINIISIDESDESKNILFEITDDRLINKAGGIIQGMSGSPIIQNNKIIGVVNYVIVDDTKKGYGIFITKMLEEGDKIISQ